MIDDDHPRGVEPEVVGQLNQHGCATLRQAAFDLDTVGRRRRASAEAAVLNGATVLGAAILGAFAVGYSLPLAAGLVGIGVGVEALGRIAKRVGPAVRIGGAVLMVVVGFYLAPLDYRAVIYSIEEIKEEYGDLRVLPDVYFADTALVKLLTERLLAHPRVREERAADWPPLLT